ncbi:MAG: aconitate hydratase B, partial [Neisseriaceae bacterium]|nr:aconitate hydratase B [Neisseriaceae bacterium]
MLENYQKQAKEREALGIPPLPLTPEEVAEVAELLKNPPKGEEDNLVNLLAHRVPPGVDDAAKVKASFLAALAEGSAKSQVISPEYATELLGTMLGGYNIQPLIELLDNEKLAPIAAKSLKHTLLMFDAFHDVKEKMDQGNAYAKEVIESWANAEWFTEQPKVPEKITVTVFKVVGETNTDDLSPAPDAWSRPDIPLHALAMLKNPREEEINTELGLGTAMFHPAL